ncbi:MAG: glycerate kinase [Gemmatimonadota bacterium]
MILVCPTTFKGTLSAREVASAMAAGIREAVPGAEIREQPLSDGGNGMLIALEAAGGGRGRGARVTGPLGISVTARYLVQPERVVVETAEACGLHLVPEPLRAPLRADTRGVGELLLAAAEAAPARARMVVGLGGSATVDGGAGMVRALGWRLLDQRGEPIPPGPAGLVQLAAIEPPAEPPGLPPLTVLADVTNPLLGSRGAAPIFAPQKGATPEQVVRLERALARWAQVIQRELGRDVADLPGAGAAGGLGAAFAAFLDAEPHPGADWVLDAVHFDAALEAAEIVVTGEGRWDAQSASMGKVTGEVLRRCGAAGVPCLLVAGQADERVPSGVWLATGQGDELDAAGLRRLVAKSLPRLLAGRRRS